MPKILQILPSLVSGGVERGTIDTAKHLKSIGWDPYVISSGGPMVVELDRALIRHDIFPKIKSKNPLHYLRQSHVLKKFIQDHEIDLVHVRSRGPAWVASRACRLADVPMLTTFHGAYGHASRLKRWYNSGMLRGQQVIAPSKYIKKHIEDVYSDYLAENQKITVVPRGVDVETFHPDKVSEVRIANLISQWRVKEDAHIIMLPGRLTHWKGHEDLISALKKVLQEKENIQCLFIGEGRESYVSHLTQLIENEGLAGKVVLAGVCRDMPAAYMVADIVVCPSTKPEAFGRTAIEAQAMGRLTIASKHGGACETVKDNKTGWLVTPGDVDSLADALINALNLSKPMRDKTIKAAIINAQNFTKLKMCEQTVKIYKSILK